MGGVELIIHSEAAITPAQTNKPPSLSASSCLTCALVSAGRCAAQLNFADSNAASSAALSAPTTLDIINNFNEGNGSNLADAMWFWQGSGQGAQAYIIEGVRSQQIPEPATLALVSLGVAGIGRSRWRKQLRR
ncbi:MAG: PEP-CTERM sorting domain-containing protein [Gammaproteobacteria bacterium]|nr:PEP-CTERM sorting domain-containing protein [Gammaproteobacteria bacterium]